MLSGGEEAKTLLKTEKWRRAAGLSWQLSEKGRLLRKGGKAKRQQTAAPLFLQIQLGGPRFRNRASDRLCFQGRWQGHEPVFAWLLPWKQGSQNGAELPSAPSGSICFTRTLILASNLPFHRTEGSKAQICLVLDLMRWGNKSACSSFKCAVLV